MHLVITERYSYVLFAPYVADRLQTLPTKPPSSNLQPAFHMLVEDVRTCACDFLVGGEGCPRGVAVLSNRQTRRARSPFIEKKAPQDIYEVYIFLEISGRLPERCPAKH